MMLYPQIPSDTPASAPFHCISISLERGEMHKAYSRRGWVGEQSVGRVLHQPIALTQVFTERVTEIVESSTVL